MRARTSPPSHAESKFERIELRVVSHMAGWVELGRFRVHRFVMTDSPIKVVQRWMNKGWGKDAEIVNAPYVQEDCRSFRDEIVFIHVVFHHAMWQAQRNSGSPSGALLDDRHDIR